MIMMKDFYQKKKQAEKVGSPVAIFKVKRVGISKDFEELNKLMNNSLEKTLHYPIYYEFTEDDLPGIYDKVINWAEYEINSKSNYIHYGFINRGFLTHFEKYGTQNVSIVTDYEYDITYEKLPQKEVTYDFSGIKKIDTKGETS